MRKNRVVVALGGNALGSTLTEQMAAVKVTATAIVDLIEEDCQVTVTHGNGPQSGLINNAMNGFAKANPKYGETSLSMCVAMSQAYIGYDLQNALREELVCRGITDMPAVSMITQVRVDEDDPAFSNPTKPIGAFMSREEAETKAKESGWTVMEDSGRGYRRVVASPKPQEIVEIDAIKAAVEIGDLVIACGGGGIPVVKQKEHFKGVPAVIDKDYAAALLAKNLDADCLVILTAIEKAAKNFGKPEQEFLNTITVTEAEQYIREGHFATGSMLPKMEAAVDFCSSRLGRTTLITKLDKAREGLLGKTGTIIISG